MERSIQVNEKIFKVVSLLGHGKGGYSYLVTDGNTYYVCKQIHHEPCTYYSFGDKLSTELKDYEILKNTGISIPVLLEVDRSNERILKQYIEGPTVYELVLKDKMKGIYYQQIETMAKTLHLQGLNIDYYPTNFIVSNDQLFYIDYECNSYMEEWNYENWGKKYWSKTIEFLKTLEK